MLFNVIFIIDKCQAQPYKDNRTMYAYNTGMLFETNK